ncbi:MAG TPA: HAMP domain-containing sensor histidine kinase [Chryseosolibacter sp.]
MKLADKFTIWFLVTTSLVLLSGGLIVFTRVQYEVDQEAIRRIKSHIDNVATQLKQGKTIEDFKSEHLEIVEIDPDAPEIGVNVYDTMAVYRPRMEALDRKLTVESSYRIGGKHYKISMYDFVAEPDEIADGVVESLAWIFLMLLVIVGVSNLLISKRILSPFDKTLKAIQNFSLKKDREINLPATRTTEFRELNYFLKNMTGKARSDYRALKEFTENASHELQTPLAIIRGKLELLLESPLTEEQGNQILSALNSIEKLSKINHSLTLLNKLENQEFAALEPINLTQHVHTILEDLSELIEMKSISLKKDIAPNVRIVLHPSLADILITNLFSNAIRHNVNGGHITINLTTNRLIVKNTGKPPEIPLEQAFDRFKRTSESNDSAGLGLAIAKQICEGSRLSIKYEYLSDQHIITVTFPALK